MKIQIDIENIHYFASKMIDSGIHPKLFGFNIKYINNCGYDEAVRRWVEALKKAECKFSYECAWCEDVFLSTESELISKKNSEGYDMEFCSKECFDANENFKNVPDKRGEK